jgi:hypothetical protein
MQQAAAAVTLAGVDRLPELLVDNGEGGCARIGADRLNHH